jgi:UDP-N-acetylmuramyl pentapeptide phosphotransferase/UDP-N-acetylglucosamine-1-phosphate transferase
MPNLASPLLAATVSFMTLGVLMLRPSLLPAALPNARSLHHRPVPQGAGIAIWIGLGCAMVVFHMFSAWALPLLALIVVSACDDRRELSPFVRLTVHAAAAAAWAYVAWPSPGGAAAALVAVWGANLFNFMDGSDGLAAAMAAVGFGSYAIGSAMLGGNQTALLVSVVAAVLPVLAMNWPPARIFLGDAGAVPLGFLAVVTGAEGVRSGTWPLWFPLFVFLPFVADASVTLLRRAWQRQRIWEAHREHSYQRLVQLGAGHSGTLAVYGTLMLVGSVGALVALRNASVAPQAGALLALAWLSILLTIFGVIDHQWHANGDKLT